MIFARSDYFLFDFYKKVQKWAENHLQVWPHGNRWLFAWFNLECPQILTTQMRFPKKFNLFIWKTTLLAEFAYDNLLLRHFQLFIFPSVVRVSQHCLGLTLLSKCRVQKLELDSRPSVLFDWLLRLDSRPSVLFDWFGRFILFWYVQSCVPLCESFEHM